MPLSIRLSTGDRTRGVVETTGRFDVLIVVFGSAVAEAGAASNARRKSIPVMLAPGYVGLGMLNATDFVGAAKMAPMRMAPKIAIRLRTR
jgi:hypothetical protein